MKKLHRLISFVVCLAMLTATLSPTFAATNTKAAALSQPAATTISSLSAALGLNLYSFAAVVARRSGHPLASPPVYGPQLAAPAAANPPAGAITVDDDTGYSSGAFTYRQQGPFHFWSAAHDPSDFGGGMDYTYNTDTPPVWEDAATWETPVLTQSGAYQVWAYIPLQNAYTTGATYCFGYSCDPGVQTYTVDQSTARGHWVALGAYNYTAGQRGVIFLSDAVPEIGYKVVKIGFDAVTWLPPGISWTPGPNLLPYDPRWANLGLQPYGGVGGEPVSTALGSFYTQHQDLSVPCRDLPVDFTRAYNSLDNRDSSFGLGWHYSYDMSAIDRGNGEVILTYPDGRAGLYIPDGSGGYTHPNGFFDTLTRAGDHFVLTTKSQTVYTFNRDGSIAAISSPNGNQLTFAYDGNGYNLTDCVGRSYRVNFDSDHHISDITDPIGRRYAYDYAGGKLTAFHAASGATIRYAYSGGLLSAITDPNNHTFVTNSYDSAGRVISQKDASHSLTSFLYQTSPRQTIVTDNMGNTTIQQFDDKYRLTQETDALGRIIYYQYDTNDNRTYIKDRGGHETFMQYDAAGNMTQRTDALGQIAVFHYDNRNNLTYQRDEAGDETSYTYDSHSNLTNIHDAEGQDTTMSYDGYGELTQLRDANGNPTTYTYDAQGNLQTVRDTLHNQTSYSYDGVGRRLSMTDANNHTTSFTYDPDDRITAVTDPSHQVTYFTYDGVGNLVRVIDRRGYSTRYIYNENDSLTQVIDRRNDPTTYTYDRMYHRTSVTDARGFATTYQYNPVYDLTLITDPKGYPTTLEYDPDHNLVKVTDALKDVTRFDYDPLHRLTTITDALNGVTSYGYDAVGRLLTVRDAKNGLTVNQYDRLGRLLQTLDALNNPTTYTYDAVGNRLTTTNARGITTKAQYDADNRLTNLSDPLGTLEQLSYDPVGNVASRSDANGNPTAYYYDANDRLSLVVDALKGNTSYRYDAEDNPLSVTDPNNDTRSFGYDPAGNVLTATLPLGQYALYTYDPDGNLATLTNAMKHTTSYTYDQRDQLATSADPLGHSTSYQYDALRRNTTVTDADGNSTHYGYDALSRLSSVIDALNGQTGYQYDPLGNLTAETDANHHTTSFAVDLLGRVTGETDPLNHSWSYAYDAVGNQISRSDANGITTNYSYDARNRLTRTAYPSGPATVLGYDGNGNLTAMSDASGAAAYRYDALDRLTLSQRTSGILAGNSLTYSYDAASNRTSVTYPNNGRVTYAYNANDWLASVTDPMSGTTTYTRDALGQPTHQQNPNATWTDYGYDGADRLIHLYNGQPGGSTGLVSSFDYTLDAVGNRTHTVESVTRGQVVTWNKQYAYDADYRLTGAYFTPDYHPAQPLTSTFAYDAVGNRTIMTTNIQDKPNTPPLPAPVTTVYTYNAANELTSATGAQFSYDANGNRTHMIDSSQAVSYTYNFENQLTGAVTYAVQPNGHLKYDSTLDYTYDGLNRRLERGVVDRGVRKTADFLYDGLSYDLIAQYVNPGSPRTTYYYRDDNQILSRQEQQGGGNGLQYFYHYDGEGNVSAWTNHSGHEDQEYMYAPFGRPIDNNGPDNSSNQTDPHNSLAWGGKPWDQETQLNYFGARDYDPATANWLTRDPYRGQLADPMTLHRYAYVGDNPATLSDINGYSAQAPYSSIATSTQSSCGPLQSCMQSGPMLKSLYGGTQPSSRCGRYQSCMPGAGCNSGSVCRALVECASGGNCQSPFAKRILQLAHEDGISFAEELAKDAASTILEHASDARLRAEITAAAEYLETYQSEDYAFLRYSSITLQVGINVSKVAAVANVYGMPMLGAYEESQHIPSSVGPEDRLTLVAGRYWWDAQTAQTAMQVGAYSGVATTMAVGFGAEALTAVGAEGAAAVLIAAAPLAVAAAPFVAAVGVGLIAGYIWEHQIRQTLPGGTAEH